jgi:hypothetical protein
MAKFGSLTKARIVESVIETSGYTHKKFYLLNIEHECEGNNEEIESQFK